MFDAFTGVVSALCLLVGSLQASYCLLVTWLLVTLLASAKHLGVVITQDWTDQVRLMSVVLQCITLYIVTIQEDWLSVGVLVFTSLVATLVWAHCKEVRWLQTSGHGHCGSCGQVGRNTSYYFVLTFCNKNQDKESKMAGLGNKKSEVAKVIHTTEF